MNSVSSLSASAVPTVKSAGGSPWSGELRLRLTRLVGLIGLIRLIGRTSGPARAARRASSGTRSDAIHSSSYKHRKDNTHLGAEDKAAVEGAHRRRAAQVVPAGWVLVAQPQQRAHGQLGTLRVSRTSRVSRVTRVVESARALVRCAPADSPPTKRTGVPSRSAPVRTSHSAAATQSSSGSGHAASGASLEN
eukprot:scaffold126070_cov75-Phaeocystis_antarctica.AAC.3